jgi:hypothetical protein
LIGWTSTLHIFKFGEQMAFEEMDANGFVGLFADQVTLGLRKSQPSLAIAKETTPDTLGNN